MSENFKSDKKFFDDTNYPHGFARSGDYTIFESKILTTHGTRLKKLADGVEQPTTDDEKRFVAVVNKELEDETFLEKTWLKYVRLITEVKRVYILADNISALSDDLID